LNRLGTALLFLAFAVNAMGGLRHQESRNPAPSSFMTMTEARQIGNLWVAMKPGQRAIRFIAPTGSMLPIFDSRCILLVEKVTIADLRVNDIVEYERVDGLMVMHRVAAISDSAVIFSGDNNTRHDGWVSASRIRWRVAVIMYTQRT